MVFRQDLIYDRAVFFTLTRFDGIKSVCEIKQLMNLLGWPNLIDWPLLLLLLLQQH